MRTSTHSFTEKLFALLSVAVLLCVSVPSLASANDLTYKDYIVYTDFRWEIVRVYPYFTPRNSPIRTLGNQTASHNGQTFSMSHSESYSGELTGTVTVSLGIFNATVGGSYGTNQSFTVSTTTRGLKKGEKVEFKTCKNFQAKAVTQKLYTDGYIKRFWSNGVYEEIPFTRRETDTAFATAYFAVPPRLYAIISSPPKGKNASSPFSFSQTMVSAYERTEPGEIVEVNVYAFHNGSYRLIRCDRMPYEYVANYIRHTGQ